MKSTETAQVSRGRKLGVKNHVFTRLPHFKEYHPRELLQIAGVWESWASQLRIEAIMKRAVKKIQHN